MRAEGRVAKQIGGRAWYAVVFVRFDPDPSPSVALGRGAVDNYKRDSGWREAALTGAEVGMSVARVTGACVITQVRGMDCDTSPGVVAVAAARAVWAAAGFVPPARLAALVESCVLRGHEMSLDEFITELLTDGAEHA